MFNLNKLNVSTTNTLVHMLYLQWIYIITQIIIMVIMSEETVGEREVIFLPMFVVFFFIILYWIKGVIKSKMGTIKPSELDKDSGSLSSDSELTSSSESASKSKKKRTKKTKIASHSEVKSLEKSKSSSSSSSESSSGSESKTLKKKPSSPYFLWFSEIGREMVMEENSDMEIKDVAREAGKIWREMDIEERNKWRNKLDELQKKYEKEKKKLNKSK